MEKQVKLPVNKRIRHSAENKGKERRDQREDAEYERENEKTKRKL